MTVKENRTILSRATIRAIAITALVAVAAVFSTQNTGVAFGSCPYTPSPGDQADLWLDMNGEDTYFTDAEWPGLEVKTFSLKGPFRGDVNIRTYRDWGLTTSTTSSEITCTTAQSYTVTKNAESMPIYLKRCNWGDYTSLQFGITHERKCILNAGQSNIYPMIITESDMEGTFLTYTTGGEDGTGNQNNQGNQVGGERECTTDPGGGSTPPTDNVPEEKPKNLCKAGTIEPILTTALSGQLNIDRTQYPGIDDHKPWDGWRVRAWRSGMGVHWKKDPSGYRNGTDAGTRDTSIPLEHPDAQQAVGWSLDQWEAWNENRQAAGLPRMHIYQRKCDRTTLTEFQVYEMYGTPWQPRNMGDFMYQADDWEDQGFWLIKLRREDMIEAAIAMRAVEQQGLELTIDNIAVQWADHPGGREANFRYEGDRELAIEGAKRKLLGASSPDTYNSDINPEQTSASIAGPWLHLGLDFRLVTHRKTRIHMTQVAHWVEGAGQTITINNLTNWYVQYHYREADMNVETDRIRAHYGVWNQYKNIWPNNTETNPWYEPMMALLGEAGVTEGQEPCQPQETTTTTQNSDPTIPTGPMVIGIPGSQIHR